MIKLIIHCGDIHIRLFRRLDEYAEQLEKFVDKCSKIADGYDNNEVRILICGDLGHSKNQITPEFITMTSYFIRRLEEIGKVIVIAGNHDLILNNTSRTDAITALFSTANFTNSVFLDEELEYKSGCVVDDNITWAVYSIYDGYIRPDIESARRDNEGNKVIGLYHGMIVGCSLPNGVINDGGLDGDRFIGCDCVMGAHVHKRQVMDLNGIDFVYCGSLIQQTFGETVSGHGFVVWNVEDLSHTFVDLESDYGLYSIGIDSIDDLDNDKEKVANL